MSVIQSPFVSDPCVPACADKDANYNFVSGVQNCSSSQEGIKVATRTLSFGPAATVTLTTADKQSALRVSSIGMPTSGTSFDQMLRPHVVVTSAADIGDVGVLFLPDSAPAGTVVIIVNALAGTRKLNIFRLDKDGNKSSNGLTSIVTNAASKFVNFDGTAFVLVPAWRTYM